MNHPINDLYQHHTSEWYCYGTSYVLCFTCCNNMKCMISFCCKKTYSVLLRTHPLFVSCARCDLGKSPSLFRSPCGSGLQLSPARWETSLTHLHHPAPMHPDTPVSWVSLDFRRNPSLQDLLSKRTWLYRAHVNCHPSDELVGVCYLISEEEKKNPYKVVISNTGNCHALCGTQRRQWFMSHFASSARNLGLGKWNGVQACTLQDHDTQSRDPAWVAQTLPEHTCETPGLSGPSQSSLWSKRYTWSTGSHSPYASVSSLAFLKIKPGYYPGIAVQQCHDFHGRLPAVSVVKSDLKGINPLVHRTCICVCSPNPAGLFHGEAVAMY